MIIMKKGRKKSWFSTKCFLIAIAIIVFTVAIIIQPEANCSSFSVDKCPNQCIICPPCEVCSSISCQTEEFCKSMGFNRTWWESVQPKNCQCPEGYIQEGNVCNPECYYSTPPCLMPSVQCKATSSQAEESCKSSGGTVSTGLCCQSVSDFPNTCLIGACGCSPGNSHEIKTCECPEGKCFDGNQCV
jgi:hypothetical protein